MIRRDDATEAQVRAADPGLSTWLSANAGSGKTRVLTDRVARLLLQGVRPEKILCLTYTKAAASEMQNRLFARLGGWAMRPDDALRRDLAELGEDGPFPTDRLNKARRLFATAIEAPGGLKIQTIHSFCATLLRRFPLEAGVSPQFHEMEDRAAALLRVEVVEALASGPDAPRVTDVARGLSEDGFDDICTEVLAHRAGLIPPADPATIRGWFGVPPNQTADAILQDTLRPGDMTLLHALVGVFGNSGSNDQKAARALGRITQLDAGAIATLEAVFLFKGGKTPGAAKIGTLPMKSTRDAMDPALLDRLNDWMRAVEDGKARRIALHAADRTIALHQFAEVFVPAYDAAKLRRGVLDFDDLIDRARALLNDRDVAEWVLYRLDGGIDHILVDEAQDTSPRQWDVVDRLALEITSGQGTAEDRPRTLFVVGDKKQSIYSFQGADPGAFDRMQEQFGAQLAHGPTPLQDATLEYSFRSAPVILDLVDATFRGREASGFAGRGSHKAFHAAMPGRVEMWPLVPKPDKIDDPAFEDPVDVVRHEDAPAVLARRIALELRRMIDTRTPIAVFDRDRGQWSSRPMTPGDVLILVQSRGPIFDEIIRALKAANVPTAGTDRLKVSAELAVRDLRALLTVLATPEDDLALATVLKSPLFGWDEQRLYTLAHHRKDPFLWQSLRTAPAAEAETTLLLDLMRQADFQRPFDLIERALTRHDGRRKLLSRLGLEAEDGINALLAQALAYEQGEIPSLTGFLAWMETDDDKIKRQISQNADQVRVMSVHGAKGLEAPVVILPDTTPKKDEIKGNVVTDAGRVLWKTRAAETPETVATALADAKARQNAERDRLLYVAMTRAEQRLIVCAAGELGKEGKGWYDIIRRGMEERGATIEPFAFADGEGGAGLALDGTPWPAIVDIPPPAATQQDALPGWAHQVAPPPAPAPGSRSPSDLGGAKALPGEDGQDVEAAMAFGSIVHRLLEHLPALPRDTHRDAARDLLAEAERPLLDAAMRHVDACLDAPDLAPLFAADALVEVPVTAPLAELDASILGVIDRLVIDDTRVLAVDFKSNATVPATIDAVPDGLLRQMGAYAAALAQIFPDRRIDTALVWTATGEIQMLPHNMVMDALSRAAHLDQAAPAP
ncbi:double-strand break repair helicase AddA [Pseudaestuariivita atlantica]|uniref:DNA 3'-5' helicase n=1 Tax=Pseudaestuariivita atlantica TaxID=1317121 RepID=A0A0L1JPG4_9RHOB|nr:double-strand break repair helicase AddA [Pseudaestuariivita atlantica]KNG93660.1 helicase UvrD [Pseudaestuariivita atlantica]